MKTRQLIYLGGFLLGSFLSTTIVPNIYWYGNNHYEFDGKKVTEKVDGIFAHTRITQYRDGSVSVDRFGGIFDDTRFYTDENKDNLVDRIYIDRKFARGRPNSSFLERNRHFDKYRQIFQEADKDFRGQIERFRSYL